MSPTREGRTNARVTRRAVRVLAVADEPQLLARLRVAMPPGWQLVTLPNVEQARARLQCEGPSFLGTIVSIDAVRGRTMELIAALVDSRIACCACAYVGKPTLHDVMRLRLCGVVATFDAKTKAKQLQAMIRHTVSETRRYRAELARSGSAAHVATGVQPRSLAQGAAAFELTDALRAVAELVVAGKRNSEIAATLGLTPAAVKRRLERLYKALEVRSRHEVAWRLTTEPED